MKLTLSWLKEHFDTDASLDAIVQKLTMIGLEVERVEDKAELFAPFKVARVVSAEQHPNADRLRVCMVDTGTGDPVQVVCGAPNARAGMKGVFVPPGAYIPGKHMTLTVGTIRGINRSLARIGVGIYEVVTCPIPSYDPVLTHYLAPAPVYPESYKPGLSNDPLYATDTNLGFSGGDVAPIVPGSRFAIFKTP